jgi:hypothetical protein
MVDAKRVAHWLGVTTLVLVGSACVLDAPLGTRPSVLAKPVTRCLTAWPQSALQLPVWDLFVVDAAWEALHEDVHADVEVDAQLCIGGVLESIELELQGSSGRDRDKKSFKIKFTRDHELAYVGFEDDRDASIDKVFLKASWGDQSLIREAVAFDLWRQMGHDAPRTGFANLRINGDYWGLYAVVEPVDKDYLRRNDYPEGGRLYKATRKYGSRADFAPGRNLVRAFEYKGDEDSEESRADLERLVETLQETELDDASFEREIDPIFPIDDYLDRMLWVSFTRNGDAVAQNFYLYNAPRDDHDFWYQIPWDSDLCMGSSWRDRDAVVPPHVSLLLEGGNYFGERLTRVPGIRKRYADRFRLVLEEILTEAVVLDHLERRADRVRNDLAEDQLRWQRNVPPDEAFDVMRNFLVERPPILREALDAMWPNP